MTHNQVKTLIKFYHDNEFLWNANTRDYFNNRLKKQKLSELTAMIGRSGLIQKKKVCSHLISFVDRIFFS